MTLKQYLILMSIGTSLCWVAWFFVIWNIDPSNAAFLYLSFFYLSFWLAVVGTFSVFGFLVRSLIIKNDEVIFRHVKRTFRQSIIVATSAIFMLMLSAGNLLTWWNAPLLICFAVFLEVIVFTNRKYGNTEYVL